MSEKILSGKLIYYTNDNCNQVCLLLGESKKSVLDKDKGFYMENLYTILLNGEIKHVNIAMCKEIIVL